MLSKRQYLHKCGSTLYSAVATHPLLAHPADLTLHHFMWQLLFTCQRSVMARASRCLRKHRITECMLIRNISQILDKPIFPPDLHLALPGIIATCTRPHTKISQITQGELDSDLQPSNKRRRADIPPMQRSHKHPHHHSQAQRHDVFDSLY